MADDTTTNNNTNNIMSSSNRSVGGDSSVGNNNTMSEAEQSSRRKHIQDILKDPSLQASEKSKMIQALMDGRRRGSMGTISSYCSRSIQSGETLSSSGDHHNNNIPTEQDDPDNENDDVLMTDGAAAAPSDIYGYGNDHRSIASSISNGSHHHDDNINDNINDDDTNARLLNQLPPGQYRQVHGRSYSLQDDWNETSRATAAANISSLLGTAENANPLVVARLMEQSRPACPHYERQCTIIAPCCGLAFGCRICHDDSPVLPPPLHMRQHHQTQLLVADQMMGNNNNTNTKMDRRRSMPLENENYDDEEENHHLIDRFQIREVICRQCFTRQSGKTYVLVVVVLPEK